MSHAPYPAVLVACLCADWCATCRQYQELFWQTRTQFPTLHFVWIDIEDDADLVDPVEVDNFPTLLVATPEQALFFGTVAPHAQTLQRLVQTFTEAKAPSEPSTPELAALVRRLWQNQSK